MLEDGEIDLLAEVLLDRDGLDPLGARDVPQRQDHRGHAVGVVEQRNALHEDGPFRAGQVEEHTFERTRLAGGEAIRKDCHACR